MSILSNLQITYNACLWIYAPCLRLLLHTFLPQTIILHYEDWRTKTTWVKMASSASPSCVSDEDRLLHMHQCYSSLQLWEFRPEEIGSENHVINKDARPTFKPHLTPKPCSIF